MFSKQVTSLIETLREKYTILFPPLQMSVPYAAISVSFPVSLFLSFVLPFEGFRSPCFSISFGFSMSVFSLSRPVFFYDM